MENSTLEFSYCVIYNLEQQNAIVDLVKFAFLFLLLFIADRANLNPTIAFFFLFLYVPWWWANYDPRYERTIRRPTVMIVQPTTFGTCNARLPFFMELTGRGLIKNLECIHLNLNGRLAILHTKNISRK